jgi:hypothetical protein
MVELNGFSLPRIKRSGVEADYLPPFSAEVKNGGVITPLQHKFSDRGVKRVLFPQN